MLLASCAVGPDFVRPAAPEITRYTREPLAPHTSSSDVAAGQSQRFIADRDIPKEWWAVFKSPALNALIERSLANNPNLQSTLATLRAAQQAVYAQEGKYFPLAQANFNPLRAQTAASLSPATASGANIYNLYTAQLLVSYTFDVWGLNRRAVESLQALADVQRFEVEAAYLALTSNVVVAAITEASLRGEIEATNQLIAINGKMLDLLQRRLDKGLSNGSDVAVQAAALAQAKATLPPLRKALAQQRDLLAALSGAYAGEGPTRDVPARQPTFAGRSAGEPAIATGRAASGRARGGGTIARRQRPGRRRHRQHCCRTSPSAPMAATPTRSLPP